MNKTYATATLGGSDRNVERIGLFVAWLVSNNLLAEYVENSAGSAVARVRMQDLSGPAFLTTVLHGELKEEHLTGEGREFSERYFLSGQFDRDYDSAGYEGEDEWHRYKEVSPRISAAFRGVKPGAGSPRGVAAKILQFPFKGR